MLVYDITNEKSFDNIKNWIRNIEEVKNVISVNVSGCVFVGSLLVEILLSTCYVFIFLCFYFHIYLLTNQKTLCAD